MKISSNLKAITFLTLLDFISKYLVVSLFNYDVNVHLFDSISINPVQTITGYAIDNEFIDLASKFESPFHLHYVQYILSLMVLSILGYALNQNVLKENKIESFLLRCSCILIVSGILGNMLNLLFFGYVVDFIRFTTVDKFVLIFNIADIYLYLAPLLVLINIFYMLSKTSKKTVTQT